MVNKKKPKLLTFKKLNFKSTKTNFLNQRD